MISRAAYSGSRHLQVQKEVGLGFSKVVLFGTWSVFLINFSSNNVEDKMFGTGSKQMMSLE